jgi:FKBP-type peptidyl-prolyl cis-trans isomerase
MDRMFRRFIPKGKITWLLVLVLIYAVFIYDKDYAPIKNDQGQKTTSDYKVMGTNGTSKFFESPGKAIIEKMQETKRGKAVVDAFVKSAIEDQYGSADLAVVASKTAEDVLAFDQMKGKGDITVCGSSVMLRSESFLDNGIKFDSSTAHKPMHFVVGSGVVIPGLEQGIIGMRQGGKRKLIIPPKFAYGNPNFSSNFIPKDKAITMEIELLEVSNGVSGITEFPQVTDIVKGIGNLVQCGQKIKVSYKLGYQEKDKIMLTDERVIRFTVGDGQVPIGVEIGIMGMQPGGVRGMVLPPKTQQAVTPSSTPLIPEAKSFPREPMVTFEVKLLAVE